MGRRYSKHINFQLKDQRDLMYSMMIIANNTVLYTLKILREILNVLITQKNGNYVTGWRC